MKEITLSIFIKTVKDQMTALPIMVVNFGKPYALITKMTEEDIKKYYQEQEDSTKEKFYFDDRGMKMCSKHHVAYQLCDCAK